MTTVAELLPGEIVYSFGRSACFVARTEHPVWPSLQLVIWRMPDGSWSHDALDARQEVGNSDHADLDTRIARLRPKSGLGLAGGAFDGDAHPESGEQGDTGQ